MAELPQDNCGKCGKHIGAGKAACMVEETSYHLECFCCTVCNIPLARGSYYAVDGIPYCEKDYMETLSKCTVCGHPIMTSILTDRGKPYHPMCFTCKRCKKALDGLVSVVDNNNAIYCADCFSAKASTTSQGSSAAPQK